MSLIISTTAICFVIVAFMVSTSRPTNAINPINGRQRQYSDIFFLMFAFAITFMAAFRNGFQDTGVYKAIYSNMELDYSYAFEESLDIQDYGFNLFMIFLKRINPDPQFLVIVTSVITFTIYFYTIKTYAYNLPMSLLLLITIDLIGTMNGIRQILAGALTLLGLPLIRDKKFIPYLLLVLLASTLHKSAMILIPLYFIISGKRMNLGIWVFLASVLGCFMFPALADSIMGDLMEDSVYKDYLQNESKMGYMRFLVSLLPVALVILYCWVQQDNHDGENRSSSRYLHQRTVDVMVNMTVVSFGFMTLGMRMVYFARVGLYFNCILAILIPTLISGIFRKSSVRAARILVFTFYLIFYLYQIYSYDKIGGWSGFTLNL